MIAAADAGAARARAPLPVALAGRLPDRRISLFKSCVLFLLLFPPLIV